MSTDFTTGTNSNICKNDLFLMLSYNLNELLSSYTSSTDFFKTIYEAYLRDNACSSGALSFDEMSGYYKRYVIDVPSNNYTSRTGERDSNKFDDMVILRESLNHKSLLNRNLEEAMTRKYNLATKIHKNYEENKLCDNISAIIYAQSGRIPHLDCLSSILIQTITKSNANYPSGFVLCEYDKPSLTAYAILRYTDSCGAGIEEPVPYYDLNVDPSEYFERSTIDDFNEYSGKEIFGKRSPIFNDTLSTLFPITSKWTVSDIMPNTNEIENSILATPSSVTSSCLCSWIELHTLSTAIYNWNDIEFEYDEQYPKYNPMNNEW